MACAFAAEEDFDDGQPKGNAFWQEGPARGDVPVFVNNHVHPKTTFSCNGRNAGEYYADPETKCAVFYICLPNPAGQLAPTSFACPNGTLFSQATKVCASHDSVHCDLATRYYDSVHGKVAFFFFFFRFL